MAWEFESPLSHQNRQVLRDLPIFLRPYIGHRSGYTRRGGYQPPENALDPRRTLAEPCRAACPHAAMTGLRGPKAMVIPAVRFGRLIAAPTGESMAEMR